MFTFAGHYGRVTGLQFQVGTPNTPEGTQVANEFFKSLEAAIVKAESYRGKILSLEESQHSYSGESSGIAVHKLRTVLRDQVILPESTLTLLDRNVIQFVKQRQRLAQFKQSTRKGLLSEYMTLARLLQPSIVVMEDVDLIARDRKTMNCACEEVLLNKLLNEMDGLKEDADILFILTTNRPETLEAALASRPERVDQAIEFPLPNAEGRRKLVCLYAQGVSLAESSVNEIVNRTHGVSAAFIKEQIRRIVQYQIERNGDGTVNHEDIDSALDEMLFRGGVLNLKLLGATEHDSSAID